jgi:hypothetical protein
MLIEKVQGLLNIRFTSCGQKWDFQQPVTIAPVWEQQNVRAAVIG